MIVPRKAGFHCFVHIPINGMIIPVVTLGIRTIRLTTDIHINEINTRLYQSASQ